MKKIILTSGVLAIFLTCLALEEVGTRKSFTKNEKRTSGLRDEQIRLMKQKLEAKPAQKVETEILTAYFDLDLQHYDDQNKKGLQLLKSALLSDRPAVYQRGIPLVINLLTDVAHGSLTLASAHEEEVNEVFQLLVQKHPDEIKKIKSANPSSPIFKYLENIEKDNV